MTDRQTEIAHRIVALRQIFAHHDAYRQVEEQFQLLLDRRRAELAAGVVMEARGIAIIGASGSGKTTAVARLLSHTPDLVVDNPHGPRQDVVSFQVPAPATLKFVGQTALEALGYRVPEPGKAKTWLVFGRNERGDPVGKALQRLVSSHKAQFRWRNLEENPYIFRIENRSTVTSHYHDVAMAMGQA